MTTENPKTLPTATDFRQSVHKAMSDYAEKSGFKLHRNAIAVLVSDLIPGGMVGNAPIAGPAIETLDGLLGGKDPALLLMLPSLELTSGTKLDGGCYTLTFDGNERRARLLGLDNELRTDLPISLGASRPSEVLRAAKAATDIEGPELCQKICVRICFSVTVDLPGPFNPTVRACVEITVEVGK